MNTIKIVLSSILIIALCSCNQELLAPITSCSATIENINPNHAKAEGIKALMDKYVKLGFPGVTVFVSTPEDGQWIGSAGVSRIENQQPMEDCNVYHSASVAKTYHVVAAMTLVESGQLDLDKTIGSYLPEWVCADLPNRNSATVRQLMNHTSGIPDFIEKASHIFDYFQDLMRTFTTAEYLDYICNQGPDFPAGSMVAYSNTNTVLLALIMDEIAGNHADLISEKIINKLNLQQTFYKNEPGYPAPTGAVNTYVDLKEDGILINSTAIERNFAQMSIGHDGMMASAHDYYTFIHGLFSGQLVSENSLEQMMQNELYTSAIINGQGLGLEIVKTPLGNLTRTGHNGGSLGAANNVFYYPEKDSYIITCSNYGDFLDGPLNVLNYSALIGNRRTLLGELEVLLFGL